MNAKKDVGQGIRIRDFKQLVQVMISRVLLVQSQDLCRTFWKWFCSVNHSKIVIPFISLNPERYIEKLKPSYSLTKSSEFSRARSKIFKLLTYKTLFLFSKNTD